MVCVELLAMSLKVLLPESKEQMQLELFHNHVKQEINSTKV
jgi:hypothetical protein